MRYFEIVLRLACLTGLVLTSIGLITSWWGNALAAREEFGYSLDDTQVYQWIDATGGVDAGFNELSGEIWVGTDDGFVGPIDLGFTFPFFDYAYSQVYIATNGVLTFGDGTLLYNNSAIPRTSPPDNYIAPFWDDLAIGGSYNQGEAYYLAGGEAGQRYFVAEWHEVTRKGNLTDLLTFEAILHENGNICYQYARLEGVLDSTTVGIEDADGVDGLAYLANQPGLDALVNSHAVCFVHPGATARVKTLPTYQSGFVQQAVRDFPVTIRNIGDLGPDTYDLDISGLAAGWSMSLHHGASQAVLQDTDGDSTPDTGPLAPGEELAVLVRLTPPSELAIGSSTLITLTAQSSLNVAVEEEAIIHAAVPAPFVQVYSDSQDGMFMDIFGETRRGIYPVISDFTGSTITLAGDPRGHYIYAWERNGFASYYYSDIEFTMLNQFGQVIHPIDKLTSNNSAPQSTRDHFPSIAVLPDGRMGVIWVRKILNEAWETNSNIYFAVLDQYGEMTHGPINVTGNSAWRGAGSLNVPVYVSPRLAASDDYRFMLSWLDDRLVSQGETSDVLTAIFGAQGELIKAPSILSASTAGETQNLAPAPTALAGGQILIAYTRSNLIDGSSQLFYQVMDSQGAILKPETAILPGEGEYADGIQVSSGEIVLGWTDPSDDRAVYGVIDPISYSMISGPHKLSNPFERQAEYISVTSDAHGHAILTWMDGEENDFLYYALVNHNGDLLTSPLIFASGRAGDPQIQTSTAGEGNAPFVPGRVFIPLINK